MHSLSRWFDVDLNKDVWARSGLTDNGSAVDSVSFSFFFSFFKVSYIFFSAINSFVSEIVFC